MKNEAEDDSISRYISGQVPFIVPTNYKPCKRCKRMIKPYYAYCWRCKCYLDKKKDGEIL